MCASWSPVRCRQPSSDQSRLGGGQRDHRLAGRWVAARVTASARDGGHLVGVGQVRWVSGGDPHAVGGMRGPLFLDPLDRRGRHRPAQRQTAARPFPSYRVAATGLAVLGAASAALTFLAATHAGLPWIAAALFLTACPVGMILPTTTALCPQRAAHAAGSASRLLGTTQFLVGALAPARAGLGDQSTRFPRRWGCSASRRRRPGVSSSCAAHGCPLRTRWPDGSADCCALKEDDPPGAVGLERVS